MRRGKPGVEAEGSAGVGLEGLRIKQEASCRWLLKMPTAL